MSTLTQGNTIDISLAANERVACDVPAGGYAQVRMLAGAPGSPGDEYALRDTTRARSFGPYGVAALLRLSAIEGTLTYDVGIPSSPLDALLLAIANGLPTYNAAQIDNRAGILPILALLDAMETNNWSRRFIVDGSSAVKPATGKVVAAAASFASPWANPATNPSGNLMRIIQATPSAHSLGAGSDGKMLYVSTSAGVPSGFYPISTRASPNQIDVDVGAANQPLITSTIITDVSRVGVYFPCAVCTIPGGIMGPNGSVQFQTMWECNSSAGGKNYSIMAGTTAGGTGGSQIAGESQLTTAYGYNPLAGHILWNVNANNVQRGMTMAASQSAAASVHAIDTTAQWYALLRFKIAVVDDWMELTRWRVEVTPGL